MNTKDLLTILEIFKNHLYSYARIGGVWTLFIFKDKEVGSSIININTELDVLEDQVIAEPLESLINKLKN